MFPKSSTYIDNVFLTLLLVYELMSEQNFLSLNYFSQINTFAISVIACVICMLYISWLTH